MYCVFIFFRSFTVCVPTLNASPSPTVHNNRIKKQKNAIKMDFDLTSLVTDQNNY